MLFQANVIGEGIIDREKPVGSAPYVLGDGLLAMYGDGEGVTIHLYADDIDDAERRIIARLGDVHIDELVEAVPIRPAVTRQEVASEEHLAEQAAQERQYDIASADIVAPLATGEAMFVAESLELLAGIDEGENTDRDELLRVAAKFNDLVTEAQA